MIAACATRLAALINRAPRLALRRRVLPQPKPPSSASRRIQPTAALVDINLPGMSGIELVSQLKVKLPKLQLMMITMYEDCDQIFASLQAGATGYLLKRSQPDRDRSGRRTIDQPAARPCPRKLPAKSSLFSTRVLRPNPRSDQLTKRETEILSQLAKGYMYKEIAENMGISMETVRTHLQHIYGKLQVHSRTEAVVKFLNK
jgi:DNA-binding NarL/FixJ family response regulator